MRRYLFQGLMQAGWMLAMVWPAMVWSQGTEPVSSPPPVATMTVQQPSLTAQAGGAQVLAGQVSVSLSPVLVQAIERGVTLTFLSEFKVYKPRWWWFVDEKVELVVRHARLTFHPLTRQFRVSVDGAKPQAFTDLTEALKACLAVNGWTVLQAPMSPGHYAQIRLSLDTSALPKALHVTALTNESWALSTGWVGVVTP